MRMPNSYCCDGHRRQNGREDDACAGDDVGDTNRMMATQCVCCFAAGNDPHSSLGNEQ